MKGVIDYFIFNALDYGTTLAARHMQTLLKDEDKAGKEGWRVKLNVEYKKGPGRSCRYELLPYGIAIL